MKIVLIGYGKIGREIERVALSRQHQIGHIIRSTNTNDLKRLAVGEADVAIEFTQPDTAFGNIRLCLERSIPVVSGSTGWLHMKTEVERLIDKYGGSFFYASNYSVGVNLFFHFNQIMARMMNGFPEYEVELEEIHHVLKKDAPSGTAITAAEGILEHMDNKNHWELNQHSDKEALRIVDKRIASVMGTHNVLYHSPEDSIELTHTAHSREGFALGAVLAAEFLQGKKGLYGMNDLLGF